MNINVFASYLKERLLGARRTSTRVGDPPKKLATRDKIEPLNSQRVGPDGKQSRVTRFEYFVMPFRTGNANVNMCYYIQKNRVITHIETINAQHPKNAKVIVQTTKKRPNPSKETRRVV